MGNNLTYFKEIFDAQSLQQAKNIVLTPDPNDVNKFIFETNWLIKFINTHLDINEKSKVRINIIYKDNEPNPNNYMFIVRRFKETKEAKCSNTTMYNI